MFLELHGLGSFANVSLAFDIIDLIFCFQICDFQLREDTFYLIYHDGWIAHPLHIQIVNNVLTN